MEEESHIGDDDVVDIGKQLVGGVVAELAGAEGIEAANASEKSGLLSQFFIDEGGEGSKGDEPGPLNIVHLLE